MADIYKAYDTQLKRVVCLKIMQAALLEDAAFTKRFQREARTAASLDHPDIIKIFDTGVTETGQPFIVMEYIQDGSLDKVTASGDLPWPLPPAPNPTPGTVNVLSLSPAAGNVGDTVTLVLEVPGGGPVEVDFDGVPAATQVYGLNGRLGVVAVVPPGASSGVVYVTAGGVRVPAAPFTVW